MTPNLDDNTMDLVQRTSLEREAVGYLLDMIIKLNAADDLNRIVNQHADTIQEPVDQANFRQYIKDFMIQMNKTYYPSSVSAMKRLVSSYIKIYEELDSDKRRYAFNIECINHVQFLFIPPSTEKDRLTREFVTTFCAMYDHFQLLVANITKSCPPVRTTGNGQADLLGGSHQ